MLFDNLRFIGSINMFFMELKIFVGQTKHKVHQYVKKQKFCEYFVTKKEYVGFVFRLNTSYAFSTALQCSGGVQQFSFSGTPI